MNDDEFFKERRDKTINARNHGASLMKNHEGTWGVRWLMSQWKMEDIGRVYRKLKELNNE